MQRPTPVTVAVGFMWLGAVLSFLLAIVALIAAGDASALVKNLSISESEVGNVRAALYVAAIVLVIVGIVDVVFARKVGAGSVTARTIYSVIAGLSVLGSIFTAIAAKQPSHWITALLPLVVIALLWVPQSSKDFFARQSVSA